MKHGTELKRYLAKYQTEQGAGFGAALRDIAADLLHIALKNARYKKSIGVVKGEYLFDVTAAIQEDIHNRAYIMFLEELEEEEAVRISRIPKKRLAEHKEDEFVFGHNKKYFRARVAGKDVKLVGKFI